MGLFKVLGAIAAGAAAVVAAPIVLPAAAAAAAAGAAAAGAAAAGAAGAVAAAGTAAAGAVAGAAGAVGAAAAGAAGTVAAAGTAAAGTVAAAGTAAAGAVAGGVAAVGTAAAGTTAGSAAIGAMTAVGTKVGVAAGAAGLSSVATVTGTSAGAAAVGTMTTSAVVGAHQGYSAKTKLDEAKEIESSAKNKYELRKSKFDIVEKNAQKAITSLAESKKQIALKLSNFDDLFKKIKNPNEFGKIVVKDYGLGKVDTEIDWEAFPIALKDLTEGILKSYAGGNIIGVAVTGGITSSATASTGIAISSLSGAAATNASLAALGGGSLASGGLGMAGGAVVAKGMVFAPALAIGGIMLNYKSSKVLEDAKDLRREVDRVVGNMDRATPYYMKLTDLSIAMNRNINDTVSVFNPIWSKISNIVYSDGHTDAAKMTRDEKMAFYAGIGLAKVLEVQLKLDFVKNKDTKEEFDVASLIPETTVNECNYKTKGIVKFGNMSNTDLGQIVEKVNGSSVSGYSQTNNLSYSTVRQSSGDDSRVTASELYNRGWRYEHGDGVPEDMELAKDFYRKAAAKGNQMAKSRLNFLASIS